MDYSLINKAEVAKLLTVRPATVDKMRRQGEFIRPTKVGGTLRWRDIDVQAWLDQKLTDAEVK